MEHKSRVGFQELIDARIAEWEKNIQNLEHRLAKKDDADAREKVAMMKARLPQLKQKSSEVFEVADEAWPNYKSETDLMLENLEWLSGYVMRRIGAA
jgi:hypothetical protein